VDAHKNFAVTTVSTAPSPATSGTSITVADASVFPATPFNVTICPVDAIPTQTNAEIARVTAIVGNVLTVTRAQESSSARTIIVGDLIAATITVKVVTDIENAIPSTAGLLSAVNVSAGATSQNLSALTFSDSNGVSFGLNGSVLTATVATNYQSQGAYLTTAARSQDSSQYAGTNGAITGGSITVNTAGVSVNLPAYLTTAMASNRGSDFVQAAAVFAGTNASGTIASNGISVSVAAPAAASVNLSAGTTSSNATGVVFSNSGGVSFGLSGNTVTATVATNYQSPGAYLTTARASNDAVGLNTALTANGVSWTVNSSGLSLNVPAFLTTAALSNHSHGDPTLALTNLSGTTASASNGLTLSLSAAAQSVQTQNVHNVTLAGNTAGALAHISSGTMTIAGGNNITVSQDGNAITISGPNVGGAQTGHQRDFGGWRAGHEWHDRVLGCERRVLRGRWADTDRDRQDRLPDQPEQPGVLGWRWRVGVPNALLRQQLRRQFQQ
jgi:hypothetical protein